MNAKRLAPLFRGLTWMFCVGALFLLLASNAMTRLDSTVYDVHMRHWPLPANDDVIIVAIDQKSLSELGRWPWPRSVHARLLERLAADGVRAVGMDIIMTDPDSRDPRNDQLFAAAERHEGHVVMPVFVDAGAQSGTMEELIPTTEIASAAASMGHVEITADDDRVARGTFLKAGLGSPYWPALALALTELGPHTHSSAQLPGLRNVAQTTSSPYLWMRDFYAMPRFAGPPGSFGVVSYVDVLDGQVPASDLKGRWVLVGVTAEGLSTRFETPTTTDTLMSGVEFQANLLASLRGHAMITPLDIDQQFLLGSVFVAFPCMAYGLPGLRRRAVLTAVSLGLSLTGSLFLLRECAIWWPPSACIAVIAGGVVLLVVCDRVNSGHAQGESDRATQGDLAERGRRGVLAVDDDP